MKFYVFIVRLPFFLIVLLFLTCWQWGEIIYYTLFTLFTLFWRLSCAVLWTAWGILMVVTTIDLRFFDTQDNPWRTIWYIWHPIGKKIGDYTDMVKSTYNWLTEYSSSIRACSVLWIVPTVAVLVGIIYWCEMVR